jgi:hypothetical protein
VRFAHPACRVQFVGEDDKNAQPTRDWAGCGLHGGQQVRRTIGTGQGWVAHGAGDDDRLGPRVGQVE